MPILVAPREHPTYAWRDGQEAETVEISGRKSVRSDRGEAVRSVRRKSAGPQEQTGDSRDDRYLGHIRSALQVCRNYKPKFGHGKSAGVSLEEFRRLYNDDEFYSWFGLDSPLVYSAHKAAGGMTSVYRQIGLGCQRLFQSLLEDSLGLSTADATWSYEIRVKGKRTRTHALDGRIPIDQVDDDAVRKRVETWIQDAATAIGLKQNGAQGLDGCVFEVRQGYKSNDAKRQNADVANASSAYAHRYLPVMALLSVQIPRSLADRYERARWLILRGTVDGTATCSTYAFSHEVLGYDLAGFFRRNSTAIKSETLAVLEGLLQ